MDILLISATAALASLLTFFTGFGLATVVTPVMLLFFPPQTAIALTAVVHLLNNLFKYALTRHHIDWQTVLRFGAPAAIGALCGAALLHFLPTEKIWLTYSIGPRNAAITPVKLTIGTLMIFFALFEGIPRLKALRFGEGKIYLGGLLSGFFGGLSGHQGALRSAFLIRAGLSKEVFIATGIAIACIVDLVRLAVYNPINIGIDWRIHTLTVMAATAAAFIGAVLGNLLLKKISIRVVEIMVAFGVSLLGLTLASGLL